MQIITAKNQKTEGLLTQPNEIVSPRRRFLGGMAISAMGMLGGCSQFAIGKEEIDDLASAANRCSNDAHECLETYLKEEKKIAETHTLEEQKPKFRFLKGELAYANFIDNLNLRYIKPHEVLRPHRNVRDGVKNELPPQSMWSEIAQTLKVADEIREKLGKPLVHINSAYRTPEYNAVCSGSATRSYHMQNCALDLVFDTGSGPAVEMAKKLRGSGFFKGGIGTYSSFIHVDTRGENATWEV